MPSSDGEKCKDSVIRLHGFAPMMQLQSQVCSNLCEPPPLAIPQCVRVSRGTFWPIQSHEVKQQQKTTAQSIKTAFFSTTSSPD